MEGFILGLSVRTYGPSWGGKKAWVGLVCAGLRFWVDLEAEREGFSFITSSTASDMGPVLSTAPPNPASSGNKLQTSHSPAPSALD